METKQKQGIQGCSHVERHVSEADQRIARLWKLYIARVGGVDIKHDLRTPEKIFRDELENARTALDVFEAGIGKERA